jgi:hypothetical protein
MNAAACFRNSERQTGRCHFHLKGGALALGQPKPTKIDLGPTEGEGGLPIQRNDLGHPMGCFGVEIVKKLLGIGGREQFHRPG